MGLFLSYLLFFCFKLPKYYLPIKQKVGVVLFLQALCFYVPHLLWKIWEKGQIQRIINDLNKIILTAKKRNEEQSGLVDYLYRNQGRNNAYAFRYFLCEVFNLFNIIIQMVYPIVYLISFC